MISINLRHRPTILPLALTWSHYRALHRVTPWPEARFERLYGDDWIAVVPDRELLAAASLACRESDWTPYLEFVPADVRAFLLEFSVTRMEALLVAARCPDLVPDLRGTPALTAYLADHMNLRGTADPAWTEINAVHERGGIHGLLEWLGLPASPRTLDILAQMPSPDLPRRLLDPLRAQLWGPAARFTLPDLGPVIRHAPVHRHPAAA